jgi:DNA-binding GntR family transcriptional regulator
MVTGSQKAPKLYPVERETVQDKVYLELRNALIQGRLSPGDTLTLRKVAEALRTSLMPVREAVRGLITEQALEARRNRTVIVPLVTAERLDELRRIRGALEGMMAEEAAQHITAGDIKKLESLNEEMAAAVSVNDAKRYLARNQKFHFIIYASAKLPTSLRIVESLWLQIGPVLNFLLTNGQSIGTDSKESYPGACKYHDDAIAALSARNGPKAREAIIADINNAAEFLSSLDALKTPSPSALERQGVEAAKVIGG